MSQRLHNFTRKQRAEIALRAGGCCEQCGARLKVGEGDADHVLAVELGGESVIENGQWLCRVCHKGKTANDIRTIRKVQRIRDKHTGAMPRSRRSLSHPFLKKKVNGTVVPKDGGVNG